MKTFASLLSVLLLLLTTTGLVHGLAIPRDDADLQLRAHCGPSYCAGISFTNATYVCGDARLGPKRLPTKLPLDSIVSRSTYARLGGLCPAAFLAQWWSGDASSGAWQYPPDGGFQLSTAGAPIEGNQTLAVGQEVDRFGSEYGSFLAPADTPYAQRSLPPQSLDTPAADPGYPYNYHIYRVEREFVVLSGPIAPWFGQPGQGTQYDSAMSVMALIEGGYLGRVDLKTHKSPRE